jgi:hypothetical protein
MLAVRYDGMGVPVCGVQFGGRDADDGLGITRLADGTYEAGAWFQERAVAAEGTPEELFVFADGLSDALFLRYAF